MPNLRFACPSCGTKFAPVESSDSATQVVRRKCRKCKERWQLVVAAVKVSEGLRLDKAELTFVGRGN